MKVLYVSDNRVRGNFGCRATSTALSQLIRNKHEITGVITGRYTNADTNLLFFCKWFPTWIYKIVGKYRERSYIIRKLTYRFVYKLSNRFSSHYLAGPCDYLSLDFEQSINNLKVCLPANPFLEEFNLDNYDFDAMVVNGEGSFIFSTPEWRWREALTLGMLMYWAQKKEKKVYFLNAMFSDDTTTARNYKMLDVMNRVLSKCTVVSVREKSSSNYAQKYLPDVKPIIIPDALFSWYPLINDSHRVTNGKYYIPHVEERDELYEILDFTKPYICIAGSSSSLVGEHIETAIPAYIQLTKRVKETFNCPVFLVEVCEGDSFLRQVSVHTSTPLISIETPLVAAGKILANAQAFISGRYHPAILASLGGTPCVFMGSNSHKTYSLQELLQYPNIMEYNAVPSDEEIEQILKMTMNYLQEGEQRRDIIRHRCAMLYKEAEKIQDIVR